VGFETRERMGQGIMKTWGFLIVAGLSVIGVCALAPLVYAVNAEPSGPPSALNVITLYRRGGPVMHAILFCSILGLSVVLERLWTLRRNKVIPDRFLREIAQYWKPDTRAKAIDVCRRYEVSMSRILRAGLMRFDSSIEEIERAIERTGAHEASLLSSNLRILGVIAGVSPMLGLLGTVTGMIRAFNVISAAGTGNPGLVAAGIAEALLTTAFGLMVGIPVLAVYHAFRNRVDKFVFDMEEISMQLMQQLVSKPEKI